MAMRGWMAVAVGAVLALAACGSSDDGAGDPGTDVIGDGIGEAVAELPTKFPTELPVELPEALDTAELPDVQPVEAVEPGPEIEETTDPGAEEGTMEEVVPVKQDYDFEVRIPPEDTVKCSAGPSGSWSGAEPDQVCLFDGGAVQGYLYLQVTVTDCKVLMGPVPTATASAVWIDVGGTVTQATDVVYEWGGNHHNDSLTFTFNGTHYRYYHWSIGWGGRACRGMDCSQVRAADGTVTDDGCTKTHTRALDCEQILPDGTHMPLVKQTTPCGGDSNFTN